MKQKGHFVASEGALDRSKRIADVLGLPFDRRQTKSLADQLLDLYYSDICLVLPKATQGCHFYSFASRDFEAYSAHNEQQEKIIEIDEQWSLFLFHANVIVTIWACVVLEAKEKDELTDLFRQGILTIADPYRHEEIRKDMWPFLQRYAETLPVANLLTTSMFTYIICHELAHHALDHLNQNETAKLEFEADTLGFDYFCQIIGCFGELSRLKIPPNMYGAPMLGLNYLTALEVMYGRGPEDIHPTARERIDNLTPIFNQKASGESRRLYSGFNTANSEIVARLG